MFSLKKNTPQETGPLVSVLIPVCNVEKYLAKCLDSVVGQTLREIEIIVINDGSTDGSPEIIRDFAGKDPRIQVIDKPNSGYGSSMNIGLDRARGQYVAIVESDDFIDPDMLAALYRLSRNGTVDVVKANFFNYYEEPGKPVALFPDRDREMIPDSGKPFTLRENGQISWGHPSVWSAIYRRVFLEENRIRFKEEKGGGWVDNPFFYETISKASGIMWTRTPYYYYRKTNTTSSSNRQLDVSLPFRRMLDNLEVLRSTGFADGLAVRCTYARGLQYLTGALKDFDTGASGADIADWAARMLGEMDPRILETFNLRDRFLYQRFLSPLPAMNARRQKILIYNWCPFDNPWKAGGGVTVYIQNLIREITANDPTVSVYMLSSGFAYDITRLEPYVRELKSPAYEGQLWQYEIVNSPVPAEQTHVLKNPTVALASDSLKDVFRSFLAKYGPFEAVHFNNIEGLSLDVLDLKQDFPETRFLFSVHNYVPFCLHGYYFMRHRHCVCSPEHTGEDCLKCCAGRTEKRNIADEVYGRGSYALQKEQKDQVAYSKDRWLGELGLDRLDQESSSEELPSFARTAVAKLNANCDQILAVSRRVYDLAAENGIRPEIMAVSYIGTQVAEHQLRKAATSVPEDGVLRIVFLGSSLTIEEKGYPFFLRAMKSLDPAYARKIELVLTVRDKEHREIYDDLAHFRSLKVINGYTHEDLPEILRGCHLSVVPVVWEDNLPQIAIESVAYGVPVLSSSAGGASELCTSELFRFKVGDEADYLSRLCHFADHPADLGLYWEAHPGLTTMAEHWKSLRGYYGLKEPAPITFTPEDYARLMREHRFLIRSLLSALDEKGGILPEKMALVSQTEALKKQVEELEKESRTVKGQFSSERNGGGMSDQQFKTIFTVPRGWGRSREGVTFMKITIPEFECSDFVAVIDFLKLSNLAPSVYDQLTISGSWLKVKNRNQGRGAKGNGDQKEFSLRLHQIDWSKGNKGLRDSVWFYVRENSVYVFVLNPGQYCGYSAVVKTLTSRAEKDQVEIEFIADHMIAQIETVPEDANNLI